MQNFYPRSPCGERPVGVLSRYLDNIISIHALLAESDMIHPRSCNVKLNFYPRSPCGERLCAFWTVPSRLLFLSTLSLRRATVLGLLGWLRVLISIHALLAESDPLKSESLTTYLEISIHALLAESDANSRAERQGQHISIHALLAESDRSGLR